MNVKLKKWIAALFVVLVAFVYSFVCLFYIFNIQKSGGYNLQNSVDGTNGMLKDALTQKSEFIFIFGIVLVLAFAAVIVLLILGKKTRDFENNQINNKNNKSELLYNKDMFSEIAVDIENIKNCVLKGEYNFKIDISKYTGI